MATYTPNNNLKKPDGGDYVLVGDLNGNMDILDNAVGNLAQLTTPTRQSLVAAINDATQMGGGHPPYFDADTATWWEWDIALLQYVDTGRPASATVAVEETATLPPGSAATVENIGDVIDVRLQFGIPRGDTGATGPTGPKGDTGAGLRVLGQFGTLTELQAAHPVGNPGDMYTVGAEPPRDRYQWNEATGAWVNEGAFDGGSVVSVNGIESDADGDVAIDATMIPMDAAPDAPAVASALDATTARHNLLEEMILRNRFSAAIAVEENPVAVLVDDDGTPIAADWRYKEQATGDDSWRYEEE